MLTEKQKAVEVFNKTFFPEKKKMASPPMAPRRKNLPENFREMPLWLILRKRGKVQVKFLRYNPEDIKEIDCIESLKTLNGLYSPSSQPMCDEEDFYIRLMQNAIFERLRSLQ